MRINFMSKSLYSQILRKRNKIYRIMMTFLKRKKRSQRERTKRNVQMVLIIKKVKKTIKIKTKMKKVMKKQINNYQLTLKNN